MPHGNRKIAFSGKKKKQQLILKRQSKNNHSILLKSQNPQNESTTSDSEDEAEKNKSRSSSSHRHATSEIRSINYQSGTRKNRNRFNLQFQDDAKKDIIQMENQAMQPLIARFDSREREIDDQFFKNFDFPKRPDWDHSMTKNELLRNENRFFKNYVDSTMSKLTENSIFELNLETWRQLWRVIEMSDCLLIVVDSRYPSCMFPQDLYIYLAEKLKKNVILILNKIDLISPELVIAWKSYFSEKYPKMEIVLFSSYQKKQGNRLNRQKSETIASAVLKIFDSCQKFVGCEIDLNEWYQKILEDIKSDPNDTTIEIEDSNTISKQSTDYEEHTRFKNGVLTIGCIGFPNVGKSSLINSLKGKKVVSVSKTPGHTKYFQTIFLTQKVKLCDCPGLVFPSSTPKNLQVIIGSYPIAQLRQPYYSLIYAAERIDIPNLLKIELPPSFDNWSAIAICEAWSLKKGFFTAKAARPDHYRAANNLLRMILEGKLLFETYPTNFNENIEQFLNHPDIVEIKNIYSVEDNGAEGIVTVNNLGEDENGSGYGSESEDEASEETELKYKFGKNTFEILDSSG